MARDGADRECFRDSCENERLDARGSLGRFCSTECRRKWRAESQDSSGVADVLAAEIERVRSDDQ
jgi:hypothetical protein